MDAFNPFSKVSFYSNIDSEEISNYDYIQNDIDTPKTFPFFFKDNINLDKEFLEPNIDYSPYVDNIINNNLKENYDNSNDLDMGVSTKIDNLCEKFKMYEIPNELSSIDMKENSSNSHSDNYYENIIDNSENLEEKKDNKISPYKKQKIFRVIYSNDFSIFNYGKYDDYSSKMIYEALNGTNKKNTKFEINDDRDSFTEVGRKRKKKKKYIKKRKQNSDNIRKKIKARFLKSLKNLINKKLERAGSKYFFSFFPQAFICNLTKENNKAILNLTLREIYSKNFSIEGKSNGSNLKKYNHNLFVLNYLDKHKDINEKINFNKFKNMKLSQIFQEYLSSKEFGMSISTLKQEKENDKYIKDYIIKANNFLKFFTQ